MKALVLDAVGRGFDFENVDIAQPSKSWSMCAHLGCFTPTCYSLHTKCAFASGARSRGSGDRGCSGSGGKATPRRRSH